jgi:hypothetical protein
MSTSWFKMLDERRRKVGEREELLAAVKARVERATTTTDMASVLEPRALIEAQHLTGLLQDDDSDLVSRYLLGWLHWYRYQALPWRAKGWSRGTRPGCSVTPPGPGGLASVAAVRGSGRAFRGRGRPG